LHSISEVTAYAVLQKYKYDNDYYEWVFVSDFMPSKFCVLMVSLSFNEFYYELWRFSASLSLFVLQNRGSCNLAGKVSSEVCCQSPAGNLVHLQHITPSVTLLSHFITSLHIPTLLHINFSKFLFFSWISQNNIGKISFYLLHNFFGRIKQFLFRQFTTRNRVFQVI